MSTFLPLGKSPLEKEKESIRREKVLEKIPVKKKESSYSKAYYAANKDRINELRRKWYNENPEKAKKYLKEYYLKNKNVILKKQKEYRKSHEGKAIKEKH